MSQERCCPGPLMGVLIPHCVAQESAFLHAAPEPGPCFQKYWPLDENELLSHVVLELESHLLLE